MYSNTWGRKKRFEIKLLRVVLKGVLYHPTLFNSPFSRGEGRECSPSDGKVQWGYFLTVKNSLRWTAFPDMDNFSKNVGNTVSIEIVTSIVRTSVRTVFPDFSISRGEVGDAILI